MRSNFVYAALISLAALPGPALAQGANPPAVTENAVGNPAQDTSPSERLNTLFTQLKHEGDADKAKAISETIRLQWRDSGSPTVNLLMLQADKAVADNKDMVAFDYLDEVIQLDPQYVEGWNQRATLNFKLGNFKKSMSDINRVLALEPRHFGAIAGMATILSNYGRDELAMEAWQRFLDIYPAERRAQKALGDIADKLAGSRT